MGVIAAAVFVILGLTPIGSRQTAGALPYNSAARPSPAPSSSSRGSIGGERLTSTRLTRSALAELSAMAEPSKAATGRQPKKTTFEVRGLIMMLDSCRREAAEGPRGVVEVVMNPGGNTATVTYVNPD
jgi:hypothetical protein